MEKLTPHEIFAAACRDAFLIKKGCKTQAFIEMLGLNPLDKEIVKELSDKFQVFPADMLFKWSIS